MSSPENNWSQRHTFGLLASAVAYSAQMGWSMSLVNRWFLGLVLLGLAVILIGHGTIGRPAGVLVNSFSRVSLDHLQMLFWTVMVLATFGAVAFHNLRLKDGHRILRSVEVPESMLVLAGITAGSFVAAPLVTSMKREKAADEDEARGVLAEEGRREERFRDLNSCCDGQVAANPSPADARLREAVLGNETGNRASLDLSKIQLLVATMVLGAVYSGLVQSAFAVGIRDAVRGIPELPPGSLKLLGLSHAGYLSYQLLPHSRTRSP